MRVFRSALMTYDTGPTADPWIILAVMSSIVGVEPLYRVQCLLPEKKSTSQLYTVSGISSMAIFVDWWTESKALLKSRARTITYGLLDNKSVTECRMAIRAAVVDPVYFWRQTGRKSKRRCWLSNGRVQKVSDDDTFCWSVYAGESGETRRLAKPRKFCLRLVHLKAWGGAPADEISRTYHRQKLSVPCHYSTTTFT